ncbi:MAG: tetratricopeptide repeat protein [Microscillaceae bacterium]|nr:tetratricopeptide repeat protein [Microscillaceae bacterium]
MKYFYSLILFAHVTVFYAYAQNKQLDSLLHIYHTTQNEEKKILVLIEISNQYIFMKPDTALQLGQKALNMAEKINFESGKAWVWNRMGVLYFYIGDYPKAYNCYQKSLQLSEKIDNDQCITANLNLIGMFYIKQKEFSKAFKSLKRCLHLLKKLKESEELAKVNNNLGNVYYYQNQFEKALPYYQECALISRKLNIPRAEGIGLNNLGLCFIGLKRYQEGLEYLFKSKDIFTKINSITQIGENNRWIAEAYLRLQDYSKAKEYALASLDIAQKTNSFPTINESAKILFDVYKHEKDFQKALTYHELYKQSGDSLFSGEKLKIITDMSAKAELDKKDMELRNQKAINQVQKQVNYVILAGLFITFLMIYLLYNSHQKEKNAKNLLAKRNILVQQQKEEIQLQAQNLKELNATKDKLFAILGHDLRSPISVLQGSLDLLQKREISPDEFMDLSDELKTRVDQVYFILNNLLLWANSQMQGFSTNPTLFDCKTLVDENLRLFQSLANSKQIRLDNEISEETYAWADRDQINIVVRNLVNNALKFTPQQGFILVSAARQDKYLQIAVKDSGLGIHAESQQKLFNKNRQFSTMGIQGEKGTGLGLILCQEMIERNQGQIWVESMPGKGATFCFTLPVQVP